MGRALSSNTLFFITSWDFCLEMQYQLPTISLMRKSKFLYLYLLELSPRIHIKPHYPKYRDLRVVVRKTLLQVSNKINSMLSRFIALPDELARPVVFPLTYIINSVSNFFSEGSPKKVCLYFFKVLNDTYPSALSAYKMKTLEAQTALLPVRLFSLSLSLCVCVCGV